MAELLLYNKNHWMDDLSSEERTARIASGDFTQEKFDARYQKGDVVEVRWYGFWTHRHNFNQNAFATAITCPLSAEDKTFFDTELPKCSLPDGKLLRLAELELIAEKSEDETSEYNTLYNTLVSDGISDITDFLRIMNLVIADAENEKYLMNPEEEVTDEGTENEVRTMVKKRQYSVDISKEVLVDNKIEIDVATKETLLTDKKVLQAVEL